MIYVYFYKKYFAKHIYSYNFHICKLNNLKLLMIYISIV
jgi:hypothetical protein